MLKKQHIVCLLILTPFIICTASSADELTRVLILPFQIHSEKNFSFLQNGIEDMLSSRLALEGKVVPISKKDTQEKFKEMPEPIKEKTAISLGAKHKTDYTVFGSLTIIGESISTDIWFVDIQKKKPVVICRQSGKSLDEVISHINLFTRQVNGHVFGRKTSSYDPSSQNEVATGGRVHPDALLTP